MTFYDSPLRIREADDTKKLKFRLKNKKVHNKAERNNQLRFTPSSPVPTHNQNETVSRLMNYQKEKEERISDLRFRVVFKF